MSAAVLDLEFAKDLAYQNYTVYMMDVRVPYTSVWLEDRKDGSFNKQCFPMWHKVGFQEDQYESRGFDLAYVASEWHDWYPISEYGKTYRFWYGMPTNEEMSKEAWEEQDGD